tara:strand:- start:62 stop:199 length:138 start_codon:yes stop_codon:yes gene_type:complete
MNAVAIDVEQKGGNFDKNQRLCETLSKLKYGSFLKLPFFFKKKPP